ncbi:MAG: hypothetical protein PW735_00900 [Acidobacteriaceae bacterium]|nr:hypothetical protein [Acidobacteriaceae bacterium]
MPPPPRETSADSEPLTAPAAIVSAVRAFLHAHPEAVLRESGKILFQLPNDRIELREDHGRCTLHGWSPERSLVRTIVSASHRPGSLRLSATRLGYPQPRLLELSTRVQARERSSRETQRTAYVSLLERVLERSFPGETPTGFRTSMDLEQSFGPAYARGLQLTGKRAHAVIGINAHETTTLIDGILTAGILWLDACRRQGNGRRVIAGLRVVVPRGKAMLTLSRMAWLNSQAASWQLYEFDELEETLRERDLADTGNLRTHLIHRPQQEAARERFADAIAQILSLIPPGEEIRVEQHLRSSTELAFLLHGFEFARARIETLPGSFAHAVVLSAGTGREETLVTPQSRETVREHLRDLFQRRRAITHHAPLPLRGTTLARRIGTQTTSSAHTRTQPGLRRHTLRNPAQDSLYRAAPERWLESVLRTNLAPLTRSLAPAPPDGTDTREKNFKDSEDSENFGNRALPPLQEPSSGARVVPHFDPRFLYAQVPVIAGASDRGMLDLLGITLDGRLAVIELKASEDLHLALQGLDYWLRIRAHHLAPGTPASGYGEFQRHGYFHGIALSPLPPRLYLIAPALHIHPATETVLRYLSPQVEWQLLALDERWREQVRVVWRRSSGRIER